MCRECADGDEEPESCPSCGLSIEDAELVTCRRCRRLACDWCVDDRNVCMDCEDEE